MQKILKKLKNINMNSSRGYFISYSMLYVAVFLIAFFWYFYYGKSPVWNSDGLCQHFTGALYTSDYYRGMIKDFFSGDFSIQMWDAAIGFGSDVLTITSFRPLMWMSVLFDAEHMDLYIILCIVIRLYLAGVALSLYLRSIKCEWFPILISSILYVFSSYAMVYSTRHYSFVNMMMFLPIMMLGIEKIIQKKSPLWFILGVWGGVISSYYYLYIISLFAGFYALVRWCYIAYTQKKNPIKDLFKLLGYYVLSVLLSMYALMPFIYFAMGSGRVGGGDTAEIAIPLTHYMKWYYVQFIENIVGVEYVGLGFVGGYSALMLLAVAMLIIYKLPGKRVILSSIVILLVCACVPLMSVIFNAFSGYTIRWCFVITLALSIVVALCMTKIKVMAEDKLKKCLWILIGYIGVFFLTQMIFGLDGGYSIIPVVVLLVVLLWISKGKGINFKSSQAQFVLLMFVVGEVAAHAYFMCNHEYVDLLRLYRDADGILNEVSDVPANAINEIGDESLYRVDEVSSTYMDSVYNRNYGLRTGQNGVSAYYSLNTGELVSHVLDMGVVEQPAPFSILSLSNRTILNTLNSVKYVAAEEGEQHMIPYGYELEKSVYDEQGNLTHVYENQNFLPYVYTYDEYITREEFDTYTAVQKEEALLQGILVEEELDGYSKAQTEFTDVEVLSLEEIAQQLIDKGIKINLEEEKIVIEKANTSIKIAYQGQENSETYLCIDDLEYTPIAKDNFYDNYITDASSLYNKVLFELENDLWSPNAASKIIVNEQQGVYLNSNLSQYYTGAEDAVVNLGYQESARDFVTLKFEQIGEYSFSDIRVVCRNMESYDANISVLKENAASNVEYTKNQISAVVETDEKKIACINVPYANGWSVTVNGEEKELFLANGMYIGVEIEAGRNEIVLSYETPGLVLGFQVSGVTILIVALVVGIRKFLLAKPELVDELRKRVKR